MLELFSLSALTCGVLSASIERGLQSPARGALDSLRSSDLPKNHHIQRGIRQAFLRACVRELYVYETSLPAGHDDVSRAFSARRHLQWPCFQARWKTVLLSAGQTQLDVIAVALDQIGGATSGGALKSLQAHLTEIAIEEIVEASSWEQCPDGLVEQLLDAEVGWFSSFAANVSHVIKRDSNFREIYQSLVQRQIELGQQTLVEQADLAIGFAALSHSELKNRFDRLETLLEEQRFPTTSEDYVLLEASTKKEDWFERLVELPFGRKMDGVAASIHVQAVINSKTNFFSGRKKQLTDIDTFVNARMDGRNNGLLVVTAPAGFGKSALAAVWCSYALTERRRVARHFCNASGGGTNTTDPTHVLDHLLAQVCAIYDEPMDLSRSVNNLTTLLATTPPNGQQLVIWLDGMDEAQADIPCFLPERLGENVCVILSARAEPNTTPRFLRPWLTTEIGQSYNALRMSLERLSSEDTEELVIDYFNQENLTVPMGLAAQIYNASDNGYALFVFEMVKDAAEAVRHNNQVDLGATPLSMSNYAQLQLGLLENMGGAPNWSVIEPVFSLLSVAREALPLPILSQIIGSEVENYAAWPHQVRRWLWEVKDPSNRRPPTLAFAHPKLATVFRSALGWRAGTALGELVEAIDTDTGALNSYALRHLPYHLTELDRFSDAAAKLTDQTFIDERFERLGPEITVDAMAADWRLFLNFGANL